MPACITVNPMKTNSLNPTDAAPHDVSPVSHQSLLFQVSQDWLVHLKHIKLSPRSIETYRAALSNLDRFLASQGCQQVESIRIDHLLSWQQWLVSDGCKPSTVEQFTRTARGLFRWLTQQGRLFADPSLLLPTPKVPRQFGICPTQAEMRALLASIHGTDPVALRDLALLELVYATAARLDEIHRLDLSSVDFNNRTVRLFGKGSYERVIPFTATAGDAMRAYLENARPYLVRKGEAGNALFVSTRGTRLQPVSIEGVVKVRTIACGLSNVTPHAIRRATATHLLQRGMPLALLKELLGHQTYRHLRHYLRYYPADRVIEVRKTKPGSR